MTVPDIKLPTATPSVGWHGAPAQPGSGAIVNIIDQRTGGEQVKVQRSKGQDGKEVISVLIGEVSSAINNGKMDKALASWQIRAGG